MFPRVWMSQMTLADTWSTSFSTCERNQNTHPHILVRMLRTKAEPLDGLERGLLPITPLSKTFCLSTASGKQVTVTRQQLPITPAYTFTDYCSQAQTINH